MTVGAPRRASVRGWRGCLAPSGLRSRSSTRSPSRASSMAVAAPAARAPTTMTSYEAPLRSVDGWSSAYMLELISVSGSGPVGDGGEWAAGAADVLGDVVGVAADAVDEVRVAVVLEALAEHVGAGHGSDPPVLADLTVAVKDGKVEPWVGAPMAGGPDDGADPSSVEIERGGSANGSHRGDRFGVEHLGGQAASFDGGVDATEHTGRLAVGGVDEGAQVGGQRDPGSVHAAQSADEADAGGLQCGEVEAARSSRPTSCSDGSLRAAATSPTSSMVLSNDPIMSSHQKMSRPRYRRGIRVWLPTATVTGRPLQCSSSASCTPVADAPTTSTPPPATSSGLRYSAGTTWWICLDQVTCRGGYGRLVAPAGGDDHIGATELAVAGGDDEPLLVAGDVLHGRVVLDRGGERGGVAGEERGDLGGGHEPVGVGPVIGPAGQAGHPVGG